MDFRLEYHLKQYTPYISFDKNAPDATLRATEVKPKLDRFIVSQIGCKKIKSDFKQWILRNEDDGKCDIALNYKMRINAQGNPIIINKQKDYPLFFGNMGNAESKKFVFCSGGVSLQIICFDSDLRQKIQDCIEPFFLTTNFGTRQSKGFGSFLPDNIDAGDLNALRTKIKTVYKDFCFIDTKITDDYPTNPAKKVMNVVQYIHSLMKSGYNIPPYYSRSFLFQYMHGLNGGKTQLGNEKAKIKQSFPQVVVPTHSGQHEHDRVKSVKYKYVRAMLGLCDTMSYPHNSYTIKISDTAKTIKRFRCPILYKIIGQYIFMLPQAIPEMMYNAEFDFSLNGKSIDHPLRTPDRTEFDLKDFLFSFADFINSDPKIVYEVNNIPKDIRLSETYGGRLGILKNIKIEKEVSYHA